MRRICGATITLPLRLLVLALDITPAEQGHPLEVVTRLRCGLEEHPDGPHFDLVRELDDASRGEVWTWWDEGRSPEAVGLLPDCPADNGEAAGANDACALFDGHFGAHSFAFVDPEYEAVLASLEFAEAEAEAEAHLPHPR
ncbi:hypothetical protein [Streptomyces sp. NPDC001889]